MSRRIRSKHTPTGNVFDSGRLSPPDAAKSLGVWKNFITTQLPLLRENDVKSFSTSSELQVICLLENRSPDLEFVIHNARVMLGHQWGFQLVVTPVLAAWAEEIVSDIPGVNILPLLVPGIHLNKLKRTEEFWQQLKGEHLLLIDTDSILCHGEIDVFLEYDYVAALWRKEDVSPWCCFGGGISLRKKSVMIQACRECNSNVILIPDESVFISMMLRLQPLDYHLPNDSVASKFAVERCYHNSPFALHKAWQFIKSQHLSELLSQIEVAF